MLKPPYTKQLGPLRCGRGWRTSPLLAGLVIFTLLAAVRPAAAHKVKVSDPAIAKLIVEDGGRLLADYGSFQLYEVDHLRPEVLQAEGAEVRDDSNGIFLNAASINTSAATVKALRQPAGVFTGKHLHLVQFIGPIQNAWHETLKKTGAQIISYLPENAYLVYGDAPSLAKLQRLGGTMKSLQWQGEYRDDYKIHPTARLVDANGNPQQPPTDEFAIQLVDDPAANTATLNLIDQLKLEPILRRYSLRQYVNVFVRLRAQDLDLIAARPDVISIQPYLTPKKQDERQDQIVAGNLTGNVPTAPGYLTWLMNKGFTQAQFTASGFAVDMSDSGIDNGTTSPNHFALYELGDTNNASRVIYNRLEGFPNRHSTIQGCDGHGNLNTHIVCAYDDQPAGFPHTDSVGYYYDLGVCPFVLVGSSVVFDPGEFTNPDYPTLMSQAYQDGARISNNSWGDTGDNSYNSDSQAYDALVRDAQPGVSGNQEMVIVFSDGDGGPGSATVTAPSTGKNVIAVGGIENVRSMSVANGGNNPSGEDGCTTFDADANSANDIASFSSRGPCADGRIKPDLVAPCSHITGGAPQSFPPPSPSGTGSALDCFFNFATDYPSLDIGICGLPGSGLDGESASNFFPVGQQFFTESSGTSHSAPAVVGACALLRQYFINQSLTPPSPAMTKAYLMNSARYVTGAGANDNLFSNNQGMGALDLGNAFDGESRILRDELAPDKFTASGQTRTVTGAITDPSKPFRVTLAWTDAPGSTIGDLALDNDLDLTVTLAGTTYKGNVFHGANSTSGGSADHRNNVESVFLPAGTAGGFTVTISAANINSGSVSGDPNSPDQDFALVIYNGTNVALANFPAVAGVYQGLIQSSPFSQANSGTISLIAANTGTFSAKFALGGTAFSFKGVFDNNGDSTSVIPRSGASSLTVSLQIDLTNGTDQVTGTVSDGTTTSSVIANLSPFNIRTDPAPQYAGTYTIVLAPNPGDTGPTFPQGNGYGTLKIDAGGKIRLSATLGDGTRISQRSAVSQNGMWPVYIPLYTKQGSLEGLVTFTNSVGVSDLGGTLTWFKPAIPGSKLYPNGFTTQIALFGSKYTPPPPGTPALTVSNAPCNLLVTSGAGDLVSFMSNSVTLNANDKVTLCVTNGFKLTLTARTGLFSGSFVNPATSKPTMFKGALLQKQNDGAGLFLGTDQTGFITVEPSP